MSITITVNPTAKQAAYRPVIFEATSNRDDVLAQAVTGITSGTGAKARYAIVSPTFLVGDIVTATLLAPTTYNVRQTITVVVSGAGGYVETDLDFATVTDGVGTLTRTNDNFQLKGEVMVFDGATKNITATVDFGGGLIDHSTAPTAHGYSAGDYILNEGTTNYNGAFKILSIPNSTSFRVTNTFVSNQTGTVRKGTILGSKRQSAISLSSVNTFRFNISNYLQSGLSPDLISSIGANIYTPTPNTIKWYSIYLTEEFDDKEGLLKSGDSILATAKQAVRSALQHLDTQTLTAFILGSTTKRFLTNAPKKQNVRVGEEVQLSFLASAGDEYKVAFQQYDLSGIATGAQNLTAVIILGGRGIVPVNSNVFDATISKVDVWIQKESDGSQMSEKITFVVDKKCYANPKRMVFENTLGGFDPYTFTGLFKQINSNKQTSFRRDLGISFAVRDRGETTLGIEADTVFEIWSEMLTNAEGIWLADLLNSPNIFIQSGADYIPITLFNTSDTVFDAGVPVQIKLQYRYSNSPITLAN